MAILAIDWGKAKIGLAVAETILAEPLMVIKYQDEDKLISQLKEIVLSHNIEKIVVGESENQSANEAKNFAQALKQKLNIDVALHDETLTSLDATILSREAGIKRYKRKRLEDAYAATLILQSYLDER